ncbi:MAG: hypothetical protein A2X82_11670 [Geobacteraceae bacterium GWC2_55_20]|nr:MAG: hypothetical protein A2X82_11670 [Geobacteraceae bacterium GWC2_55_20]OGU23346.1 MAG: hypothetical protein A2X85_17745 [Geobacteraceae bacterium GWF2_54_21]HCE66872.1 hypothetical protein [Geobacter sp.]
MNTFTTDIAKRETLATMIGTYQQATSMVEQAYAILEQAQNSLRAVFMDKPGYRFSATEHNCSDVGKNASDTINSRIKKDAWAVIVERMELRRLLSIQRRTELDCQIEKGELPDLTDENVMALFETSAANVNVYLDEAILEVFEYLRPRSSRFKTNTEYELGKRVILTWQVEKGWNRGKFRVNYHRDKQLTALDNVFHMIDGKGPIKSYHGPLYDAITDSPDGTGKTEYFKFRCCINGNLHLEFLKPALVAKLNAIAGGNRLRTNQA